MPVKAQATYLKSFEKDGTILRIPTINLADAVVSYQDTPEFYQFNITLTKPTTENVFNIPLETSGLNFYYQPPLTETESLKEYDFVNATHAIGKTGNVYRPINVVSSYAVYKANAKLGEIPKLYHIYRPLLIDSKGATSWANLSMSKTEMQIICDNEFLAKATYPVVIDPTIGTTSIGGSTESCDVDQKRFAMAELTEDSATFSSISAYMKCDSGTVDVKAGIYPSDSLDSYDMEDYSPLVESSAAAVTTSWTWVNFTIDVELDSGYYGIGVLSSGSTDIANDEGYGGADNVLGGAADEYDDGLADPFGSVSRARKYMMSIFATYGEEEIQEVNVDLEETLAVSSSLDLEKSLYRVSSESTIISTEFTTTKTLIRTAGENLSVTTILETEKDIHAVLTELFETVIISTSLETTKHIAATFIELAETVDFSALIQIILPTEELTTDDLIGLIIVFFVIAISVSVALIYSKSRS